MNLAKNPHEAEGLIVYSNDQTSGKGQRGNQWLAESGKNILMSLLLRPKFLDPKNQFYLNLIAGLAIVDAIESLTDGNVTLKWPNDVYLNGKKLAGILIENNLRGSNLESSVVGIGLNVNQKSFNMPKATSLRLETGQKYDLQEILEELTVQIERWYLKLKSGENDVILSKYHELLMWRGEQRKFKVKENEFLGEIIGIDEHGRLAINHHHGLHYYGIKEVEFIS